MNLYIPEETGDYLTTLATVSFSRRNVLHGVSQGQNPKRSVCFIRLYMTEIWDENFM
jgi:hypothetical protein